MADDDILAEARAAGLTLATGTTRIADALIRAARDHADQRAHHVTTAAGQAQQRYEAQAHVAERLYLRAADPDWMRTAGPADSARVRDAAQVWADLDNERFTHHADVLGSAYREVYGEDPVRDRQRASTLRDSGGEQSPRVAAYDAPASRQQRDHAMAVAGWPDDARTARTAADHLNAHRPYTAASVASQPAGRPVPGLGRSRSPSQRAR